MLRHVRQQRHVAVAQRRDGEALPQPEQPRPRVGPPAQPVPDSVEMVSLRLAQALQTEARQQLVVQDAPVQRVDRLEGQLAPAHPGHHRLVPRSELVSELRPVDVGDPALGCEGRPIAGDAGAPVHHRAEDVEGESLDRRHHRAR